MKNSFIKHFLVIGFGTFVSMFLGFITTPIITRIVDPADYGQYSIFVLYSNIAVMVLCMGLDQSLVRYYYDQPEQSYKAGLLKNCVKFPIVLTLCASAGVILFAYIKEKLFGWDYRIVFLLCVFTLIQLVYRFSLLLVRLEYNSKLYSKLNIANKAMYVAFVLIAFKCVNGKYLDVLAVSITVATFICMIISILAQKRLWLGDSVKCDSIKESTLLKYGAPYIISMGITMLFQACDQLAINYYCDYSEVGIYASAMTLVHIFAIVQTTFNTLWAPMAVEHYSQSSEDVSFYQKGNQAITVVMFAFGIAIIMLKNMIVVLLGAKYREASAILPFLIFNPIMYTISETTVSGLVFKKKSNMQVFIAVGACLTNIVGNTLLVPKFGCTGAAISTGISYIVFFTLRTFISNKFFYVNYDLKKFYILTLCTAAYALYNTFYSNFAVILFGGIFLLGLIVILYRDSLKWMIQFGKQWLFEIIKKERWGQTP